MEPPRDLKPPRLHVGEANSGEQPWGFQPEAGRAGLTSPAQAAAQRAGPAAPVHPEHSGDLPENPGRQQPIARKALGHCSAHLLYIRVGISIWEDIRVLLPEDVAHSAAGDDLEAAPAHPHPEGDFCKTARPPIAALPPGRRGHRMAALRLQAPGSPRSLGAGRAGCIQPRARRLPACSTSPATSLSRPTTRVVTTRTWEGGLS